MEKAKKKLPPEFEGVEMFNLKKHKNWLSGGGESKVYVSKSPVQNSIKINGIQG